MTNDRGAPPEQLSLTRKQLYDMVWSTPMLQLARNFRCSSTWLARICRESSVPVPPRGYWAKKRAGKATRRQALRRSADPDEIVVSYTPAEEKDEKTAPPPPPPPLDDDLSALRIQIEQAGAISIADEFDRLHPVVTRTRRALRQAEALKHLNHGLLQPRWAHDGCILGMEVSVTGVDRALRLFEGLFRAAESFGGKVVEKDKSPAIRLLGDKARFFLRERPRMHRLSPGERRDYSTAKIRWEGSGVFELSVSTDDELGSQQRWSDGRKGQLEDRLQQVLIDTLEAIQEGRRWQRAAPTRELERRRQLEEERERQIEQFRIQEESRLERERVTFLLELTAQHTKATQLRDFLAACRDLPDRDDAANRWIAWGEKVLDELDPLSSGLGPILQTRPAYGPPLFAAITRAQTADA